MSLEAKNPVIDSLMIKLNEAISNRPQYLKEKEKRLSERYKEVAQSQNLNQKFDALTLDSVEFRNLPEYLYPFFLKKEGDVSSME